MHKLIFAMVLFAGLMAGIEIRPGDRPEMPSLGVSSLTSPAMAASKTAVWPGPFEVEVLSVKDGDTVEVEFKQGPCGRGPCPGAIVNIRILGIDAPESHRCGTGKRGQKASGGQSCAKCEAEWLKGGEAKHYTLTLVAGRKARVSGMRPDKYGGRIVAALEVERDGQWVSVGDELLEADLAVPYDGGRKTKPWCGR